MDVDNTWVAVVAAGGAKVVLWIGMLFVVGAVFASEGDEFLPFLLFMAGPVVVVGELLLTLAMLLWVRWLASRGRFTARVAALSGAVQGVILLGGFACVRLTQLGSVTQTVGVAAGVVALEVVAALAGWAVWRKVTVPA